MSLLSNFESKVEGAVDGAAAAMFSSPIEPAQIAKKAEKQMKKEKLVGSGRQYAPTLYNVLVNERDDKRLFGFYPTMASEIENYLYAKGTEAGMEFDTRPLVRFIPDPGLKKGRFDVIAEVVAAPIIKKLRDEEMEYYGLAPKAPAAVAQAPAQPAAQASRIPDSSALQPLSMGKRTPGAGVGAAADAGAAAGVGASAGPSAGIQRPAAVPTPADSQMPAKRAAAPSRQTGFPEPDAPAVIGQALLFDSSEQVTHHLDKRKLTAGRGKDNDIVVADANASRLHARLSQDATGQWKLTDLDSTNGTLLNGRPVTSALLKSGDEITIGTTVLQFTE